MKGLTKKDKQKIKEEIDFKNRMFDIYKDYEIITDGLDFGYISGYRWFLYSYNKPSLKDIEMQINLLQPIEDGNNKFNTGLYYCERFAQGFTSALHKIAWKLRCKNNMDLSMYKEYDPSFFEIWD